MDDQYRLVMDMFNGEQVESEPCDLETAIASIGVWARQHAGQFAWLQIEPYRE